MIYVLSSQLLRSHVCSQWVDLRVFLQKDLGAPRMKYFHSLLTFIVITTFTLIPSFAFAQEQDDSSENELEEIIVFAQRRDERLQEAPISMPACTRTDIEKLNISEAKDYFQFVGRGIGLSKSFQI